MKILITGAAGLLGHGLVQVFHQNHDAFPLTRAEADITDAAAVRAAFKYFRPELVIHAAAIPDLDICESDPARAQLVNVEGTRNVVESARAVNAAVAYISTDAVFDELKNTPYTESDATNPPTVYGRTKLLAEHIVNVLREHWVFRIPVLFGPGKTNFVDKGLRNLASGEAFIAASDQIGGALYTLDAAQKIMEVVEMKRYGVFHLANTGACSRLDIALRAAELAGLDVSRVIGKKGAEMGRRAVRLKYAVMDMQALRQASIAVPRPWEEALAEYIHTRS
ncbi:MAG TPA: NAD(P)-dependent oxidoreductase [Candidatus Acidoferrales bacterium]|nr:NAD(P)-dependent oxidoreductase [Candidatus Acidoferrales bacterium]